MFTRILSELPEKIAIATRKGVADHEFIAAIKTRHKPNDTIPYLWLICTTKKLLICNTHKTRGLYESWNWAEINQIRKRGVSLDSILIEVIFQDLKHEDNQYPLDPNVTLEQVDEFLSCCAMRAG